MKIVLENNALYNDKFIQWLVRKFAEELILECNPKELLKMSRKLNMIVDSRIDICDAFMESTRHIRYSRNRNNYHIFIDPLKLYRGSGYKLITLAKFINYGNNEIAGCLVYSKVARRISTNLEYYFNEYLMTVGVI